MIRLVIVDSNKLLRHSLHSLISTYNNYEVAAEVGSLKEITNDLDRKSIRAVIFQPEENHNESLDKMRAAFPQSKLVILSRHLDRDHIIYAMNSGVAAYFSKEDCPTEIERCIKEIDRKLDFREIQLGNIVRKKLVDGKEESSTVKFSKRELEVLSLVCQEKTNAEISDILGLSIRTVESHRRRMTDKSSCKTIIGVILNAIELKTININKAKSKGSQAS